MDNNWAHGLCNSASDSPVDRDFFEDDISHASTCMVYCVLIKQNEC